MMRELARYDWSTLGAQGSANEIPEAIRRLVEAEATEDAERAYWEIDNTAVVQGRLYEAALPTVRVLVNSMYGCTHATRPFVLELLVQLASGPNASDSDAVERAHSCRRELLYGVGFYFFVLENGSSEEQLHCVDLLGLCALVDRDLLPRVRWHFDTVEKSGCSESVETLMRHTLADVSGSSMPQ